MHQVIAFIVEWLYSLYRLNLSQNYFLTFVEAQDPKVFVSRTTITIGPPTQSGTDSGLAILILHNRK